MTENPPPGGYPPPPQGGYPPPPPPGGYPPPPPPGGYPPPPQGGYPPPPGGFPPPQGGFPPPPQGGYPPPPQGNFPPPQGNFPPPGQGGYPGQGDFGAQGYPPPGQGFPPAGGPAFSIGEAFGWAWNKFTKNAMPLVVSALVYAIALGALAALIFGVASLFPGDYSSSSSSTSAAVSFNFSTGGTIVLFLGLIVLFVAAGAIASAYMAGVLDIANGQQVELGSFFKPRNIGAVVVASLLVGVATSIGYFLCFLPGLVISAFTLFTTVAIVDRNLSAVDGIKASFELTKSNLVHALLVWLIFNVLISVGSFLCYVGLLVTAPVAVLLLVYTYRVLNRGYVAPAVP